ncbi:MAG: iron-containing alcohol dehydrogenase [Elusimicrobiota bacterium]|nr:iron-containing alcohol dehydrogenase [Elusimicrobiota bacterium]
MNNFEFYSPTRIIFGRDTQKLTGAWVKKYASKILLHYGGGSVKKSGLYDAVAASLKEAGVEFMELGGVSPNPKLSLVYKGIELCRRENIRFILAVGGGSVIDSAKAIAVGVDFKGDVWDLFLGKAQTDKALPVATVLTIPAAGSEASGNSVVTNEETKVKAGYRTMYNRPVFSILNPELCYTLPKEQMANGVCDMMAHLFERYFTRTPNTELTDKFCEGALKTIINNAPKLLKDFKNYDAWAEIMFSGYIAHNGLLGMGRQEDWAPHAIEHAVSALYDVAHGAGLAIIFPAWMRYVYKEDPLIFAQFAVNVWGLSDAVRNPEELALKAIERTEQFFKSLGLPARLSEIGVKKADFAFMAEHGHKYGSQGFFKKLTQGDILKILELAY